jgi:hypothetical protein
MSEYAVMAETHEGNILTLRRGFPSLEAAESHPIKLSLWKFVWVERLVALPAPAIMARLPWSVERCGNSFTYIRDADGRRVASLHGVLERRDMIEGILREAGLIGA